MLVKLAWIEHSYVLHIDSPSSSSASSAALLALPALALLLLLLALPPALALPPPAATAASISSAVASSTRRFWVKMQPSGSSASSQVLPAPVASPIYNITMVSFADITKICCWDIDLPRRGRRCRTGGRAEDQHRSTLAGQPGQG